ncbi:hypothetical protein [Sphaerothrix gracilis]|uniref:hypothetical protein n=1 Tax=Sphaerothrix gracilis TaxID=3151835 RepID=UPI0031FC8AFA
MYQVHGSNCLEAWKEGCKLVVKSDVFNLVTTVKDPNLFNKAWLDKYNARVIAPSNDASLSDVINTIFPCKISDIKDRQNFYKYYLKLHERKSRFGSKKKSHWGTYFQRLISFGDKNINQLELVISLLNQESRWLRVTNPIHISSAEYDSLSKRLGNPCLQYIQFIQPCKQQISLVALYRNHDFFNKALGNLIGLGQLLNFVALSTGKDCGEVICHSVHAYSKSKLKLKELAEID